MLVWGLGGIPFFFFFFFLGIGCSNVMLGRQQSCVVSPVTYDSIPSPSDLGVRRRPVVIQTIPPPPEAHLVDVEEVDVCHTNMSCLPYHGSKARLGIHDRQFPSIVPLR